MSDLNLYSVNWQDGMLLTQQHLKDQETYLENLARWYGVNVGDRFGLIRKSFDGQPALIMSLSVMANRLIVELVRCQAVTPDGSVIEINETNRGGLRAEAEVTSSVVPVFVAVGQPPKKEIGEPDPAEDPPRFPYRTGNYSLHLGAPPKLPQGRYLHVAELAVGDEDVRHAETFYPPCLSTHADERLTQKVVDYRNRLENLLSLCSRAYTAMSAEGSLADQKTSLQEAFRQTIYQFAYHLSASLDLFVVGKNGRHPLELVIFFKRFFRVFTTLLNLQPGLKDYLNERFFVKEMNSEVGRFMASVDAFLMADYDHNGLGGHLKDIDSILGTQRNMMGFLAQVKKDQLGQQAVATDSLTYQGQTYRAFNYGEVRVEQVGELTYLLIDITEPGPVTDAVILMNKDLYTAAEWSAMQVRLGLNEARGLGETDPVEIDAVTYGSKVALHPQDMLKTSSVRQITLIFRGAAAADKFTGLGKMDLIVYSI